MNQQTCLLWSQVRGDEEFQSFVISSRDLLKMDESVIIQNNNVLIPNQSPDSGYETLMLQNKDERLN